MKTVVFYEGDTERNMFRWLIRKYCHSVSETESMIDFETTPDDEDIVYFHHCHGYENVLPEVRDNFRMYENHENVVIIRDLEDEFLCFTGLKESVDDCCVNLDVAHRLCIFAKPNFEEYVYLCDLDLLKSTFFRIAANHAHVTISNPADVEQDFDNIDVANPEKQVKRIFRKYGVPFNKVKISDVFFSQFDYLNSGCEYFSRIIGRFEHYIDDAYLN